MQVCRSSPLILRVLSSLTLLAVDLYIYAYKSQRSLDSPDNIQARGDSPRIHRERTGAPDILSQPQLALTAKNYRLFCVRVPAFRAQPLCRPKPWFSSRVDSSPPLNRVQSPIPPNETKSFCRQRFPKRQIRHHGYVKIAFFISRRVRVGRRGRKHFAHPETFENVQDLLRLFFLRPSGAQSLS